MKKGQTKLEELLSNNLALSKSLEDLKAVLIEKFGEDSAMYESGLAVFADNALSAGASYGIPLPYLGYWKPFKTDNVLHHITIRGNIEAIKQHGLEPRDPSPRPWAGMKAIFMGEPSDPLYARSEQAVIEHAKKKGTNPVLLHIKTKNNLYKSVEPGRTFQVISVDPISPSEILAYKEVG